MIALKTERLLLREFRKDDWEAVHGYASDAQVVRFLAWGPSTEDETRDFIARQIAARAEEPRRHYGLAVTRAADNELIGSVGLNESSPDNREAWIGYCLARHCWGQGYATEAARAVIAFGFGELDLHRIFATCDVRNVASARVLEKAGMQREGRLREHKWQRGGWRDSYLYAILRDERCGQRDT
jgi:RimJ/RimL family protein N-acetyltransferase